jgi:hypothetical protein
MNGLNIVPVYQKIKCFALFVEILVPTGNSGNFEDSFLVGFRNWKKAYASYLCFIYIFLVIIINLSIL